MPKEKKGNKSIFEKFEAAVMKNEVKVKLRGKFEIRATRNVGCVNQE